MLPVKQRAAVWVVVTAAVAASATYAWRTKVPFEQAQRWLVIPALIATVAALWGSRLRSNGDRVAWIAIAGSCPTCRSARGSPAESTPVSWRRG